MFMWVHIQCSTCTVHVHVVHLHVHNLPQILHYINIVHKCTCTYICTLYIDMYIDM